MVSHPHPVGITDINVRQSRSISLEIIPAARVIIIGLAVGVPAFVSAMCGSASRLQ